MSISSRSNRQYGRTTRGAGDGLIVLVMKKLPAKTGAKLRKE